MLLTANHSKLIKELKRLKARDAKIREQLEIAKANADDSVCLGKICEALLLLEGS
jgi:hypothetical protein